MLHSHATHALADGGGSSLTSYNTFALMVLCIFMLGRGPSLNSGVTGAGFGNLVFYCLGVGKWVLLQAEDEIRLCQKPRPPCLLPLPLEAYCSREDQHSISPPHSVLYRFSMLLLSLHLALSFLPGLSCSWTLSLHPRFHPSSFSRH